MQDLWQSILTSMAPSRTCANAYGRETISMWNLLSSLCWSIQSPCTHANSFGCEEIPVQQVFENLLANVITQQTYGKLLTAIPHRGDDELVLNGWLHQFEHGCAGCVFDLISRVLCLVQVFGKYFVLLMLLLMLLLLCVCECSLFNSLLYFQLLCIYFTHWPSHPYIHFSVTLFFSLSFSSSFHIKKRRPYVNKAIFSPIDKLAATKKGRLGTTSILSLSFLDPTLCTWMSDLAGNEHLGRAAWVQYLCCLVLSASIVYFSHEVLSFVSPAGRQWIVLDGQREKELPFRWASRRPSIVCLHHHRRPRRPRLLFSFSLAFDRWLDPTCDKL